MEIPIYEIFDRIRSGEMGDADVYRFLRDYSNNYDAEMLQFILRDLDFYFFMEKEEKESEISPEIKEIKLKEYEEKNKEIPTFPQNTNFTEKQLKNRARIKEKGLDLDSLPPMIDWEKILYPYEFMLLYRFKYLVEKKLKEQKEKKLNEPEASEIPENDYSDTVPLERMIILEKLGIIKYIQSLQNDKFNEKHTAEILSSFTGIIAGTISKNLGVMGDKKNDKDKNSPYKNPKNLNLASNKLDKFNIDLNKIIK